MRGVCLFSVAALAAAVVHVASGSGAPARPAVIDLTYLCTNTELNGVRKLAAWGRRGFREAGRWKWPGSVNLLNRGAEPVARPPSEGFPHQTDANWSVEISAGGGGTGIEVVTRGCTVSAKRPALESGRLSGGAVDYFGDSFECRVPRRVLVRVRGEFREAATLRRDAKQPALRRVRAEGRAREVAFVVQTEPGARLAFGRIGASGQATFFFGAGCVAL